MVLKNLLTKHHSVPLFEGSESWRHRDVPLWKLALKGGKKAVREVGRFGEIDEFVQFIGFPRSGHSLIGSIIDAHPQAVVSHELDTMGLIKHSFPQQLLYALILRNSAAFTRNDRYWNGFSYVVPGQYNGRADPLRVVGDKKGDWAVRWCEKTPGLLETAYRSVSAGCRWILVTRNPLDNIATMSLRKGGTYDELRIASNSSGEFRGALRTHQERGEIPTEARDDMIADYEGLCETIHRMRTTIPDDDQSHLQYERFCSDPEEGVRGLCHFLGVPEAGDYVSSCASIVKSSSHKSRTRVTWTQGQLGRVERLARRFPFLQCYVDRLSVGA